MPRKSFKLKIIIPTVAVLVALVLVLNVFLSIRFSALSNALVDEKLVANINSLKSHLEGRQANSAAAAVSMAFNPEVVKAVQERDTIELLRIFTPRQNLYRINFFTLMDGAGTVLARTHEPDNFGDSLLDLPSVREALEGRVASYFETGTTVKVSVHTVAPVYDGEAGLIGLVLAGVRFDSDSAVEELKKFFNSEVTVFLGDTRVATTITRDGHSAVGTKMDPFIAKTVIENRREFSGDLVIFGEKYKTFYTPLINARGEAFATFFLGIPEADLIKESNKSIRYGIILGLGGLAASILLLFNIISSISEPIIKLSKDMNHIADGNLLIDINVKTDDEVGHLGQALQKVANILHKLLEDIHSMIQEQEKGNTDYCLNTDEFHGDYKILAESVLELLDFGMKDQLTGIPNRRSFDKRMDLEWKRAIREKKPVSMLIIDVDKFKNYNDTFGHQQGDAALKTVARTIKNSLMRSIDFAARWGGEEFVVLLPTTDSTGALMVAEKIRTEIEKTAVPGTEAGAAKVTVSIGIGTQVPTQDTSASI
ncbi:MAG: diguanylate cyclase, partial [Candidatus Adiutrix sp.]|nr:diguanylate cyclase [Candidatus Adiutrix sp.]